MSGTEDEKIEQVTIKTVRKFKEEGVKARFVLLPIAIRTGDRRWVCEGK